MSIPITVVQGQAVLAGPHVAILPACLPIVTSDIGLSEPVAHSINSFKLLGCPRMILALTASNSVRRFSLSGAPYRQAMPVKGTVSLAVLAARMSAGFAP